MQRSNQHILITADVDESLINKLSGKGFYVDVIPFIKTAFIQSLQLQQQVDEIASLNTIVIFTSSKAVEAVHEFIQHKKVNWKVYCVGNATQQLIQKLFPSSEIISVADNAAMLAQQIIQHKNQLNDLYFFCGDKKRDELPVLLADNKIVLHVVEVYETTILNHLVKESYDAVLFFSPSAVNGFFKNNHVKQSTVLFAIGNTTATAITGYSGNKIVVADEPNKNELINKLIEYFQTTP